VYLERRLLRPRHIEVQLLGDQYGTIVPFVERECSIQRRHQKLIEETPSTAVSRGLREAITSAAARVARAVGYTNAGTIEFLLDGEDDRFYFLEMNTRLQVEHPITEMVTGVDLVAAQIGIARGERLELDPRRLLTPEGHAVECRVYAEDPGTGFMPSPGRITHLRPPSGPGVRDDSGVVTGSEIPIFYDSLVSKVAAWAVDRPAALARMTRAMTEYEIRGVRTTIPFFQWIFQDDDFKAGRFDTTFVDRLFERRHGEFPAPLPLEAETVAAVALALYALEGNGTSSTVRELGGRSYATDGWRERARVEALRDWPAG
jgi:acetyl-CoA carboxylase biotin carboxylase subunit